MKLLYVQPALYSAFIALSIAIAAPRAIGTDLDEMDSKCPNHATSELISALYKLKAHPGFSAHSTTCALARKLYSELINSKIELTGSSKLGRPVICATDSRDQPCKIVIGQIANGYDSNFILGEAFGMPSNVEPGMLLEETYKRLFYKPSKHARHSK